MNPPENTPRRFEHRALVRLEQVVAPVERRAQRLLARKRRAAPAGEQLEAVLQADVDLVDRQRVRARRSELERERNAVEVVADGRDRRRGAFRQPEGGLLQADALDEHLRGFGARQRLEIAAGRGQRQRRHRIDLLAGDLELLAAAREDANLRRGQQQRGGERGAGVDQVLAIVEQQQQTPRLEMTAERLREVDTGALAHAQHLRDRARHQRRIGDRAELDEPHAVGIRVVRFGRHLQREARLADAAHAHAASAAGFAPAVACTSAVSCPRPTNDEICCGRLFGVVSSERSAGKSCRSSGCTS